MKPVGSGLGNVIYLRRAVASLIDGIGKGVDRYFRDRVQSEHQICREAAVQIGERVVCFQAIDDVTVGESGQAVEFNVAIPLSLIHI